MSEQNASPLIEYLLQMLARHPGLSKRQASLRAGLNENAVQQLIIANRPTPEPRTLKLLADTWGTPEDYRNLMRLAGYQVPDPVDLEGVSPVKRRAIELLVSADIPDRVAAAVVAGLEEFLKYQEGPPE